MDFMGGWFVVLVVVAHILGHLVLRKGSGGILIDNRGRYSLTHLQLVTWTIVVISLLGGVFTARLAAGVPDPLSFVIPSDLLIIMGISLGGAAGAIAIKTGKDESRVQGIAASNEDDRPRFSQIFLVEEGEMADKVVDIAKYQNFWFTILLLVGYVALTIQVVRQAGSVGAVTIPDFSESFLVLLGVKDCGPSRAHA